MALGLAVGLAAGPPVGLAVGYAPGQQLSQMRLDCCAAVAILQNNGLLCQFSRELAATWMVSGSVCVDDLRLTTRSLVKRDTS